MNNYISSNSTVPRELKRLATTKRIPTVCISFLLALVVLVFTLVFGQSALAAKPDSTPPGGHLNITGVNVVFTSASTTTFFISGEDLDFGSPLTVTLGGFGPLDIIDAGNTGIIAKLDLDPDELEAGDYLLTVSRGNGQSQNDEYDLTIGAVGSAR